MIYTIGFHSINGTLIVLSAWLDKKDDIYIPIKKAA